MRQSVLKTVGERIDARAQEGMSDVAMKVFVRRELDMLRAGTSEAAFVSHRRADIQRGARAAARLVREHAATWPAGLSVPQDARDAREFAERIALAIEHTFSDEEIERRIQAAIDDAVLAEFDARSQEG